MAIDERGTIDKVTAGDFSAMDMGDAANIGQMAAGQMVGIARNSTPLVGAVAGGAAGVASLINSDKEATILSTKFSKRSIRDLKRQNPALRKKLSQLEDRWQGDMVSAVISTLAGAGGGFLAGMLIPIPGAAIVGSLIGGFIGNKIYDSAIAEQAQDPVVMNTQVVKIAESGEGVPVEAVFATLAANLSGKEGKTVGKILKKYTGTELFHEALADHKNIPKLQAMMNNPVVDDAIRAHTGMPRDINNPLKTVAEQYAELINSGKMQAKNMLNTGEGMYVTAAMQRGQGYNVDVPVTPEARHHAVHRSL